MTKNKPDILKEILNEIHQLDFNELASDGLYSGKLGLVYFYSILLKDSQNDLYVEKISDILSKVLENVENQTSDVLLNSSIFNGLSGLGYSINNLISEGVLDDEYREQLDSINEIVVESALEMIENDNFDFLYGPIGILYYLNQAQEQVLVNQLVDKLYTKWNDNLQSFYNETAFLEGIHMGYAHGLHAIVKVLDEIDNNQKCEEIIHKTIYQLKTIVSSNKINIENCRYFLPRSIHKEQMYPGEYNWKPVLAWSNSDLNFATLIHSLNKKHITGELIGIANEIAIESTSRTEASQTLINDHRFFFGSSGVAHMYAKLNKEIQHEKLEKAHKYWLTKTIDFLNNKDQPIMEHKLDFINQLPGTCLMLLQNKNAAINRWDKIFLL